MTPHLPDIQGGQKRLTIWTDSITGRICGNRWIGTYQITIVANIPEPQDMQRLQSSDLCLYRNTHEKTF